MKGRPVKVKVEQGSTFTLTRDLSSLFIYTHKARLRTYTRKNYATVEIHLYSIQKQFIVLVFP